MATETTPNEDTEELYVTLRKIKEQYIKNLGYSRRNLIRREIKGPTQNLNLSKKEIRKEKRRLWFDCQEELEGLIEANKNAKEKALYKAIEKAKEEFESSLEPDNNTYHFEETYDNFDDVLKDYERILQTFRDMRIPQIPLVSNRVPVYYGKDGERKSIRLPTVKKFEKKTINFLSLYDIDEFIKNLEHGNPPYKISFKKNGKRFQSKILNYCDLMKTPDFKKAILYGGRERREPKDKKVPQGMDMGLGVAIGSRYAFGDNMYITWKGDRYRVEENSLIEKIGSSPPDEIGIELNIIFEKSGVYIPNPLDYIYLIE